MGERDSSKTRVAPVFSQLVEGHRGVWIDRLIQLPKRFDGGARADPRPLGDVLEQAWWPSEKTLPAPEGLLRFLLLHPDKLTRPPLLSTDSSSTGELRRKLLAGDGGVRGEALRLLHRANSDGRRWPAEWYVFEGPTHVDAFFRTGRAVVVIEGKRTEKTPTTTTEWMPMRHQMLRLLDCAREAYPDLLVLGFFIVEGEGQNPVEVPTAWRTFSNETLGGAAVAGSLPHRTEQEQALIAHGYLGVATWQAVCAQFGLDFKALPDTHH